MFMWQFIACISALQMAYAYPQQQIQRLADTDTVPGMTRSEHLVELYKMERTLSRLRRALSDLSYEEPSDDMELAEINVFRPLFRYRAEVARQVKNPQQQQFG